MKHDYKHVLPKNSNEAWCQNSAIVVLFGENRMRKYEGGQEIDVTERVYMPYAVQNVSDLDHVDLMRKRKGYGVAGVELLDNVKNQAQAALIKKQIDLLTKSPELELELKEKDAKIAELEAKLAAADGSSARIVELEAKLAAVDAGGEKSEKSAKAAEKSEKSEKSAKADKPAAE